MQEDHCNGQELLIPGPAGAIETLSSCPECFNGSMPIAVICHPHPLHGGTMRNKVVHVLAETFVQMGLLSVTFNFRGVGKSQGRFDKGIGEQRDLIAVVRHFKKRYPHAPIWLAGFSFGSYVSLCANHECGAEQLLLVAPPVELFDFTAAPQVTIPWMVIQGGKDEITPPEAVAAWLKSRSQRDSSAPAPIVRWMSDADHFFHGRLSRIRDTLKYVWQPLLKAAP
ncbi:MAG: alpha/beta fold hydrolase [Gammaproteobacteria bacterium]|nr:alpha/beta fold hydrolase [Gammaproteobacteria bacterium]